jgi:hypothetical protein
MTQSQTINIRALRGAPITVLFALFVAGGQSGTKALCLATGYSDKTVGVALEILSAENLVTHVDRYNGWVLTSGGRQLPLSWPALEEPSEYESEKLRLPEGETENFRLPATATALKTLINTESVAVEVVKPPGSRKNSASREVLQVLTGLFEDYKIGPPTCHELSADPEITPARARAHLRYGRRRGDPIGLVIHRMKSHDPPPKDPEDTSRYVTGPYADLIEQ